METAIRRDAIENVEPAEDDVETESNVSAPTKDEVTTTVYHKGHACVLSFNQATTYLRLSRVDRKGKTKTYMNVPASVLLNMETAEERDLRQRKRQMNDDTTKIVYVNTDASRSVLCGFGGGATGEFDSIMYIHSRGPTGTSTPGARSHTPSMSLHPATRSVSSQATRTKYFIHYLRARPNEKTTIHTVELSSKDARNYAHELENIAQLILSSIYTKGYKNLVVFISPKSGKGHGKRIFNSHVRPILHFSRHAVEVRMTTRAHDCEDYVADLHNKLDSDYVVVCAGGDGMVHEACNGLYRRRLALLHRFREDIAAGKSVTRKDLKRAREQKNTPGPDVPDLAYYLLKSRTLQECWETVLPLIATVATGSACGVAKSLGVLSYHNSALSLVHLNSCRMDLMRMQFTDNPELQAFTKHRMGHKKTRSSDTHFKEYQKKYGAEIAEREKARQGPDAALVPPFLKDGTAEYSDPSGYHYGIPTFPERIAFMSLSFGMANDIDHGSEHLRWMGNARFAVYGGYVIMKGIREYTTVIRYLPWESRTGFKVEKLHLRDKMPDESQLAPCTMRDNCPHCRQYPPVNFMTKRPRHATEFLSKAPDAHALPSVLPNDDGSLMDFTSCVSEEEPQELDIENIMQHTDAELLNEDAVDFDDDTLPWVTVRCQMVTLLLCNLRDVAQDMIMAPLSHLADGAIDICFCRRDGEYKNGGRKEFVQFFVNLEKGSHVDYDYVSYVKARAVEVKVDAGISMSDGELMPMSSVRLTKVRHGVQFVRTE